MAFAVPIARAQTNLSAFFGAGSAWDSAAPGCVFLNYPDEPSGSCTYKGFTGYSPPALGGTVGVFGGDFMFRHHLGVGGEYTFGLAQRPYGDAHYRPEFYDFNALYHPITTHFAVLEVQGGLGGFDTKFYLPSQCSNSVCSGTPYLGTPDHLQVHAGVGVKIYILGGVFIRPQFDIHFVPHLNGTVTNGASAEQFGSDWVPEGTVSVGYTFGER